jgi:hypothetical protein
MDFIMNNEVLMPSKLDIQVVRPIKISRPTCCHTIKISKPSRC